MQKVADRWRLVLIFGDILTLGIITLVGFASHGTVGIAGSRMFTTFLPLVAAWFLIAPNLRSYDYQVVVNWQELWRPFWSMVLAAPIAAWLRGLILDAPILPIFVIILGGVSAIGILLWRIVAQLFLSRFQSRNG